MFPKIRARAAASRAIQMKTALTGWLPPRSCLVVCVLLLPITAKSESTSTAQVERPRLRQDAGQPSRSESNSECQESVAETRNVFPCLIFPDPMTAAFRQGVAKLPITNKRYASCIWCSIHLHAEITRKSSFLLYFVRHLLDCRLPRKLTSCFVQVCCIQREFAMGCKI